MRIGLFACAILALPLSVAAQNNDELWEIKSQMNIPGMPAGMGAQTARVCQGKDPGKDATRDKDMQKCKVNDVKQTATRTTVTMTCPEGRMVVDQQYNAARTEFKGSMKMTGKDGDMTMTTTGRKVGACDVQEAKRESDARDAAVKKQVAAGMAASAAMQKQMSDQQIKECNVAVDKMEFHRLGAHGQCYKKAESKDCKESAKSYPEATKACGARVDEFCKRFQTADGFMKASNRENAAQMCGVSTKAIKTAQCPRAEKAGSLAFLGAYCPVEAKPLADVQCVGRDFTSKQGGKYAAFCLNYMANADFESGKKQRPAESAPAPAQSQQQQQAAPPASEPASATDQVKQGVSKGLDKLKGLFGR